MGFSHYYRRPLKKDHDQETWNKFIADCKTLYKNMPEHSTCAGNEGIEPLILNGCWYYKNPQFNKSTVHFNGAGSKTRIKKQSTDGKWRWEDTNVAEANENLDHETFVLNRKARKLEKYEKDDEDIFDCCKTARKPYDLMVCACLILYKYYFPYVQISSDGNEEDWKPAWEFIAKALPHGYLIITELKLHDKLFEEV